MVIIKLDDVIFQLKEEHDFSWLNKYGRVFCVFSKNDSGNISFGLDNGRDKYFIKVAGTKTAEAILLPEETVKNLKAAIPLYEDLKHPNLIQLIESYQLGDTYVAIFKWIEGECLFDYWNFDTYRNNPKIKSPAIKFKELSIEKRLKSIDIMFSFLINVSEKNYVSIDFYDGSIIYDFETDTTMICDIDFFRKKPTINDIGEDFWGTKRLKSPEEYIYGAAIDERTNVFTLGGLILNFFGSYSKSEINKMYQNNKFHPCSFENWQLDKYLYEVVLKAVDPDRDKRYKSISEFYSEWKRYTNSNRM